MCVSCELSSTSLSNIISWVTPPTCLYCMKKINMLFFLTSIPQWLCYLEIRHHLHWAKVSSVKALTWTLPIYLQSEWNFRYQCQLDTVGEVSVCLEGWVKLLSVYQDFLDCLCFNSQVKSTMLFLGPSMKPIEIFIVAQVIFIPCTKLIEVIGRSW